MGDFAPKTTPDIASPGGQRAAWVTRDGAQVGLTHLEAMVAAGQGFHVTVGALSTPIQGGGAGTIVDLDQPEFVLSVPAGTAVRPIRVHVQAQAPLSVTDNDESEILIAVDRTAAWAVDGTYTSEVAFNMRTDNPVASGCSAASAFTADTTDPVLGIELARSVTVADVQGSATTVVVTKHELLYEPKVPPIIVGPAMLIVYWGGTVATSGFAEVEWVEYPSTFAGLISST